MGLSALVARLRSSRRTVLLVLMTIVVAVAISTAISILLERTVNLHIPTFGTIRTLGVEAYWDERLNNRTEAINWGIISLGSSRNVTFHVVSTSNIEATLYLEMANAKPTEISEYMSLSWNYQGAPIKSGEILQVTLDLSISPSEDLIEYLVTNEVRDFSFDIIIGIYERPDSS